jgi:hypothetical protein
MSEEHDAVNVSDEGAAPADTVADDRFAALERATASAPTASGRR